MMMIMSLVLLLYVDQIIFLLLLMSLLEEDVCRFWFNGSWNLPRILYVVCLLGASMELSWAIGK